MGVLFLFEKGKGAGSSPLPERGAKKAVKTCVCVIGHVIYSLPWALSRFFGQERTSPTLVGKYLFSIPRLTILSR